MTTALELFKKAGLEDYLRSGAIGAGIGGLGMGAASYLGNSGKKNRGTGALQDALKGALLGGAAGAGVEGVKELGGSLFRAPETLDARAIAAKNPSLDSTPHSQGHPIESTALNLSTTSPYATAGLGAGAGMLLEKLKRNAGNTIASSLKTAPSDSSFPANFSKEYNNIVRNANSVTGIKDAGKLKQFLVSLLGNTNSAKQKAVETALKGGAGQSLQATDLPGMFSGKQSPGGHAANAFYHAVDNVGSKGILNKLLHYGKSGLAGGLIGGVGQLGASAGMNALVNHRHSPEQLALWEQLANAGNK